jgi:hypothetical protein
LPTANWRFSEKLQNCKSADDIPGLLQDKAKVAFSGLLGEAVARRELLEALSSDIEKHLMLLLQVPFQPAKVVFVCVDVLLSVRSTTARL